MKYLKKFEESKLCHKYKIGDYLFLKAEYFGDGSPRFSKIIDVDDDVYQYKWYLPKILF